MVNLHILLIITYPGEFMKKYIVLILVLTLISMTACKKQETPTVAKQDIDFTVCKEKNCPKELLEIVEQKKKSPFKMTYSTKEYMYILVGYGEQSLSGYSINVTDLYLDNDSIYIDTNLVGPSPSEKTLAEVTYPYIIVKIMRYEKTVIFK